jgi:predicted DNA-binding protein
MKKDETILEVNVPQEWSEQFERLAKQSGHSVSELVREALAQYLDNCDRSSIRLDCLSSDLESLKADLANLVQKVNLLSENSHLVATMSARLTALERIAIASKAPETTISMPSSLDDEDDDDFDEPDEILMDFLPR